MTINIGKEEINNDECYVQKKTIREPDVYDEAIEYLTAHPEDIYDAWASPGAYEGRGGELFGFVAPQWDDSHYSVKDRNGVRVGTCGCLQQIREAKGEGFDGTSGHAVMSYWNRLWDAIASDRRIPSDASDITVEDLPVFAEWQREIDEKRKQDGFL